MTKPKIAEDQRGFTATHAALVTFVIVTVIGVGYAVWRANVPDSGDVTASTGKQSADSFKPSPSQAPQSEPSQKQAPSVSRKTYDNKSLGVKFQYPSNWVVEETKIPSQPNDFDPMSFSAQFSYPSADSPPTALVYEVHEKDIAGVERIYDRTNGQHSLKVIKTEGSFSGGKTITYKVQQARSVSTDRLYEVGAKTYVIRTINEELNQMRSSTYQEDVAKLFEAVEIRKP